jgi:RNA polymerase sigma-70 factor (ECF subfamily)
MDHDENLDSLSDEELAKRFFKGSSVAFDVLHARYREYVRTCCYNVIKNQETAEELAQDTFERAARKIRYFLKNSAKRNFKAWIRTIACNLAINRLRREKGVRRATTNLSPFQIDNSRASEESDPVQLLKEEERRQALRKVIDELPEPRRTILIDRWFREMERKEIAKTYEISIHQVDHHLRRARAFLKRKMWKMMQDDSNCS